MATVRSEVMRYSADDAVALRADILEVYKAAWSNTPFALKRSQIRDFDAILDRQLTRADYRLVVARFSNGAMAGFAYGYTSAPGGWWRDIVTHHLDDATVEKYFTNCFEFVELAVHPGAQGRGFGGQLHDALLEDLPHATSALSTQRDNERAVALYERRGWTVLDSDFYFPNRTYPYVIYGLQLQGRAARSTPSP